jgi:excisionase family DNA binding protein
VSRGKATSVQAEQLFFTYRSAAALCDVSEDVLKDAVRAGRLRGKRTGENGGGLYLFRKVDLEAWFSQLVDA